MIAWLNNASAAFYPGFLLWTVQNTLFLGLLFLTLHLLRNTSARLRHNVALAGLVKIMLPPVLPLLPQWNQTAVQAVVTPSVIVPVKMIPEEIPVMQPELLPTSWLILVWAGAGIIILSLSMLASFRLHHRLKTAEPVPGFEAPKIYKSPNIPSPLIVGLIRPKIVVPRQWNGWPDQTRDIILRHEMAHLKRRDNWVHLLQIVCQALFFFHPLMWMLNQKINQWREMACDDAVAGHHNIQSMEYARALVQIAEETILSGPGCVPASALIRQKQQLLSRIQYQMEGPMNPVKKQRLFLALALLFLLALPLSATFKGAAPAPTSTQDDIQFVEYDEPPQPVGGYKAIQHHLAYPKKAQQAGEQGRTLVYVQIDEKGTVVQTRVMQSIGSNGTDETAINAIESVKWIPAKKDGKTLKVWIMIPIDFTLGQPSSSTEKEKIVFVPYDEAPVPIGGYEAVFNNLAYPTLAKKAGIEGRTLVYAQIDEQGDVVDTRVMQSLGPNGTDEAAVNAIKSVQWKPARQQDQPVKVWIMIPIDFSLSGAPEPPPPAEAEWAEVIIYTEKKLGFEGTIQSIKKMEPAIRDALKRNPNIGIRLKIDKEVNMGEIEKIRRAFQDLGVTRFDHVILKK